MIITSKLKMNLQNPGSTPIVHAVQNDSCTRHLEFELVCGTGPFIVPETAKAIIRYRKSDSKGGEYDTLPDGTPAWWVRQNILTVALAPQVLTTPGSVSLTVTLIDNEHQLSVFPLRVAVQPVSHAPIAESEDYFYVTGFLPAPVSAKIGQQFRVSEVSETGQVTGVEAFDPEVVSGDSMTEDTVRQYIAAYLEEYPPAVDEQDPTVPDWAKQARKPEYTASEIGADPSGTAAAAVDTHNSSEASHADLRLAVQQLSADKADISSLPTVFLVSVTGANGVYTADKTLAELADALDAGRPVYCNFTGEEDNSSCEDVLLPFVCWLEGYAVFGAFFAGMTWTVLFNDSGAMALMLAPVFPEDMPEKLPNPQKLVLKGAVACTYDGSEAVTVTVPTIAGEKGEDGISPTVQIYEYAAMNPNGTIVTGKTITITDANGEHSADILHGTDGVDGADGYTPVKGVDYWTEEDQESMIQQVIAALGTPVFGTVDEDNNIILSGELANGTYTLKYEDAEGNVTTIGTLAHTGGTSGYTNLADPSSADWRENSRINSSLTIVDAAVKAGTTGGTLTNYIPCVAGDVIRVKGLNVAYYYSNTTGDVGRSYAYFYSEDQTIANYVDRNIPADDANWINNGDSWQYTVGAGLTSDTSAILWCRMQGYYYDGYSADSVIITVNEEID